MSCNYLIYFLVQPKDGKLYICRALRNSRTITEKSETKLQQRSNVFFAIFRLAAFVE